MTSTTRSPRTAAAVRCLPALTRLEDRLAPALTFRFDYSLDTAGFFTDGARRHALEQAGADLAGRIASTPAGIGPGGANTWRAVFAHPSTGAEVELPNLTVPEGALVVYAGGMNLGGSEAAEGGPGGFAVSGPRSWQQTVSTRGLPGYSTWGGSLSVDTGTNWYFGADPNGRGPGQSDFYSVAVHELSHVLGLGTSPEWDALVRGGRFTGPTATAVYGSAPPVSPDGAHFAQNTRSGDGPVSLQPVMESQRVGFSQLDYAALADLGWQVAAPGGSAGAPAVTPVQAGAPGGTGAAARQLVVTSGPTDGTVLVFAAGPGGALTPVGGAFRPFGDFGGPVRSVAADVNGDGIGDLVFGTGPFGGSRVRVVDGATFGDVVPEFQAFEPSFAGGVFLAAGDFDRDGRAEVVVTPDEGGGSRVKILTIGSGGVAALADFYGIDDAEFRGGARAAVGDVNGDGVPDLVVSAGFGGGPRVAIFDGTSVLAGGPRRLVADFFAFEQGLRNGAYVAVGDTDGDGLGDVILGAGPGGGPRLVTLSGQALLAGGPAAALARPLLDQFVGDPGQRGGLRVTAKDLDADDRAEVLTGSGTGGDVRVFQGGSPKATLAPFGGAALDGVYVG